ncbi:hypothetical protein [Sphingomonas sp. 28-63-12]|uniref:hypothetical protein n=1 Tax=Sphingomonas sp. 28-63-12 TaxID=1970434 RepID=UPI0035A9104C
MCSLYTVRKSAEEIAAHFGVDIPTGFNTPEAEVYPGPPGLVVREAEGQRVAAPEFGSSAGLVIWSIADALDAGLRYIPSYVLTLAEIEGLANGGRATLRRA